MTNEHTQVGRLLGVDAERVHVRRKFVELEGITRDEFYGLVTKLEGSEYRLSLHPPGTPLRLCNGNNDTWDALFSLYQKGSVDADTIHTLLTDYEGDVPKFIWDMLAGSAA